MSDRTRPAVPAQKVAQNGSRTAEQIEADLTATRERLAETVDELVVRVQPKEIASRGAQRAKLVVMTADGRPRTARLVTAVVVTAAVVGTLHLLRTWVRRRG